MLKRKRDANPRVIKTKKQKKYDVDEGKRKPRVESDISTEEEEELEVEYTQYKKRKMRKKKGDRKEYPRVEREVEVPEKRVTRSSKIGGLEKYKPPKNRREEILNYLKLFGYNDRTIIQVYRASTFRRRRRFISPKELERRRKAREKYGGTTFVVIGRTHDDSILQIVTPPRKEVKDEQSYIGYLFKGTNKKPPHELIPLDFVPVHFSYPLDWKDIHGKDAYLLTMHVKSGFAKHKNALLRSIYRLAKKGNVKNPWTWIEKAKKFGYEEVLQDGKYEKSEESGYASEHESEET